MRTREDLSKTIRGYWPSRALLTAAEIGLFPALGRRRLGAAALARRLSVDERALSLLLHALTGLEVLVMEGNSFRIAPAMVPFLTDGPESALGMLAHHAELWRLWDHMTETVRTGKPARQVAQFKGSAEEARQFTLAMRDGAIRFAAAVAEEIGLRGRRRLVDLGGGPGIYAVEIARLNPDLEVLVMDLPDVSEVGREIVAGYPDVAGRVSYHPGDIDRDPLPEGIDAALLSHVIHGKGEKGVRRLFGRVAKALPPGGLFVVRDFLLARDGTSPAAATLFSLNVLVATPNGRCYTAAEGERFLRSAGFSRVRFRRSRAVSGSAYLIALK